MAAATFAMLLLAWWLWGSGYQSWFRRCSDFGFAFLGLARVEVLPVPEGTPGSNDTVLVVRGRSAESSWWVATSSFFSGYLPTVVFLAFFAGVYRWRRRLQGLGLGLLLLHGYVFLRLVVALFHGATVYARQSPDPDFAFLRHGAWQGLSRCAAIVLLWEPTVYALVPVVILVVVCGRRGVRLEDVFRSCAGGRRPTARASTTTRAGSRSGPSS